MYNFCDLCIYLTLILIASLNLSQSYSGWVFDKKKANCGLLFTGPNYGKDQLLIRNPQVISDMSVWRIDQPKNRSASEGSENWDNRLASVRLYDGCKLKACNGTHLEGNCVWFNKSATALTQSLKDQVSSVGCSCPVENCNVTTCSKATLRRKDCARAYFEPHCRMCEGSFVIIKKNHAQPHFGGYENKIKSVVVNKGCQLTYFTEEEFEEEEHILNEGAYEDFGSTLGSYRCNCAANSGQTPLAPKNPDYPTLMDFSATDQGIQDLAKKYPKHVGLDAALTSIRHKRSPTNAYILLIGLTGAGKSSTINLLFDNANITTVGSDTSTTNSIHEYRIPVQVDELGCKNCELRVIDTPGFGDTSGLELDAKFLAGLETYLTNHEELRHRIPNIVLVVSKFTDNRFKGRSSNFVKTLRGIEYFKEKLFDLKYSNAITVLTHFMSEPKRVRKNSAAKIREFRQIIEDYTLFPKPVTIVVAENRPEDQDLVLVNGYYLLPNGDYYPQNLFEKIQVATEKGHDPIGEAIIRTAFKAPENLKFTEHIFRLQNVTFSREPFFLGELNARNFQIELTEVSNITAATYRNNISMEMKRKFPGTLQYLQRVLNLRNMFTTADIPRKSVEILKLFRNIRHNELIEALLLKAFDLQIPHLDVPLLAGQCYNVLTDLVLPETPVQSTTMKVSDTGFKLPDSLSSSLINDWVDVFNLKNTKLEYSRSRLAQLRVEGTVNPELGSWKIRPGFNTLESFNSKSDPKARSVTALKEYRLFQITLNTATLKLKPEFLERVKNIPPLNDQNHTIVEDWKLFFGKYGTHVISSAYGGGAIQVEFKVKDPAAAAEKAGLAVKKSIEEFFKFLDNVYLGKSLVANDIDTKEVQYALRFVGGDYQFAVPDFSRLSISQTSALLDGFAESLQYQPTMLETSLSLIPLSVIVQKVNREFAAKISNATASLLNAKLVYSPPPPPPPPLERPEVKKRIAELKADLQRDIDLLSKEMKENRDTFDKYIVDLVKENDKERQAMLKKLKDGRSKTLEDVFLNCVYREANLGGDKVCNAEQNTCICMYMGSAKSVNTYNSCVQYFKGCGCTGTAYRHSSNETHNTNFPFDLSAGGFFSVINC